ncbi:MAG: endonuclease III [Nanoarchaeota archaeon]
MEQKTALKQLTILAKKGRDMRLAAEQWKNSYETLISIILSARTRDETTIKIAHILFKKFPTAKKLANANIKSVQNIIRPVNFYRNKSRNIINCAKMLIEKYNGVVPKTIEELITLPGVGRKTANVFIVEHGEAGLGVDTHVHYISNYLGWTKNKSPHKVEEDLKNLFPKKYWSRVNATLVRFGKTHTSRKQKDKLLNGIKKVK